MTTITSAATSGQLSAELPRPQRARWQPLRLGLVELFHYDTEEFWFRDGHLLLRGNNGTGKSKVLALTLPFLLDGDLRPQRVEPDGDPGKRMDWNLLLGGAHTDRIGYAWIEFGRRDGGAERTVTLGCGLKAVTGRGVVASWFFHTPRRIGVDLHLVDRNSFVLPRERLRDAVGDAGGVHDTATRYRRVVDEQLFGLGTERYDALVSLLIQLRQPQLSKRPDEAALSRALTESLPPLGQDVIADVAAAMRTIDDDRAELARLEEARAAVGAFAERYQRYAAVATKQVETALRRSTSDYERTGRALAEAQSDRDRADQRVQRLRGERGDAERERRGLDATERTLRDSPAMRDATRLHDAASRAERAAAALRDAEAALERATDDVRRRRRERSEADAAADEARSARTAAWTHADRAASAAGLQEDHIRACAALGPERAEQSERKPGVRADDEAIAHGTAAAPDAELVVAAETRTSELAERRTAAVNHLRELARTADAATADVQRRREEAHSAASERDGVAEDLAVAGRAAEAHADAYVRAVTDHLAAVEALPTHGVDVVLGELAGWVEEPDDDNPLRTWLDARARTVAARTGDELARLEAALATLDTEIDALRREAQSLRDGVQPTPTPPPTRARRPDRPGAPLWQLVDFVADVSDADRAGLEAALEASGLLDAWVTPDGGLLDADELDVAVTTDTPVDPALAAVLRPADADLPVPSAVVDDILAGIGLGAATAPTWVAADGRYRLGVAEGAWAKDTAEYVGHAAREAARRRRLDELDGEIADLGRTRATQEDARAQVHAQRRQAEREVQTVPTDADVRRSAGAVAAARRELVRAEQRVDEADRRLDAARTVQEQAAHARDTAAGDLDLPATTAALDAVAAAVADYRVACSHLWAAVAAHRTAAQTATRAAHELAAATRDAATREAQRTDVAREADDAAAEHQALRDTVGVATAEVERRLAEVEARRAALGDRVQELTAEVEAAQAAYGQAQGRAELLVEQQAAGDERRRADADALRRLTATGIVAAAVPELDLPDTTSAWAPSPSVELARRLDDRLADVDAGHDAWERISSAITRSLTELQRVMSAQAAPVLWETREGVLVVHVRFRSTATPPHELVTVLDDQLADRRRLLDEREREILENHLVSEVASQLSTLISDAEAQVERVNAELRDRPTSTGMVLRFRWLPDADAGPVGLAEARSRLLRQAAAMWSPDDRAAVGAFLQAEISRQRAADEAATWHEHLARAFDYRSWHRFVIERRTGDGGWRRATGPASGGERVLAVTLPLFAAASAHYSSAVDTAPRLVLLDEAFAGVDDAARQQCMGLLTTFDLDYVLTSEREWGCYPEVPGLSICHLVRREGIDAVHVSRWEWDGSARTAVAHTGRSARQPPPPTPAGPASEGGLLDGVE